MAAATTQGEVVNPVVQEMYRHAEIPKEWPLDPMERYLRDEGRVVVQLGEEELRLVNTNATTEYWFFDKKNGGTPISVSKKGWKSLVAAYCPAPAAYTHKGFPLNVLKYGNKLKGGSIFCGVDMEEQPLKCAVFTPGASNDKDKITLMLLRDAANAKSNDQSPSRRALELQARAFVALKKFYPNSASEAPLAPQGIATATPTGVGKRKRETGTANRHGYDPSTINSDSTYSHLRKFRAWELRNWCYDNELLSAEADDDKKLEKADAVTLIGNHLGLTKQPNPFGTGTAAAAADEVVDGETSTEEVSSLSTSSSSASGRSNTDTGSVQDSELVAELRAQLVQGQQRQVEQQEQQLQLQLELQALKQQLEQQQQQQQQQQEQQQQGQQQQEQQQPQGQEQGQPPQQQQQHGQGQPPPTQQLQLQPALAAGGLGNLDVGALLTTLLAGSGVGGGAASTPMPPMQPIIVLPGGVVNHYPAVSQPQPQPQHQQLQPQQPPQQPQPQHQQPLQLQQAP